MKIGCIGLGDIAQRAYLPVLATRPGAELHLYTLTPATLARTAAAYHVPDGRCHGSLDGLLAAGIDAAFVHSPTSVHAGTVTRLLEAGIATYTDAPLAYRIEDSRRLVELAESHSVSLCAGFSRRFAPAYAQCLDHPRELILMQKNRTGLPGNPRTLIFGDFIHVADTLRFLLPGPAGHIGVRARIRDELMHHAVLQLSGDGFTAIGMMNWMNGSTEEILEVSGQETKRQVLNLADVIDHKGQPSIRRRGDWVPPARQRGIEQAVSAFLDALAAGRTLSARDALKTHELCEKVVEDALRQAA
ncbi:Gfo/Idh/MocA family oxidoreductase [Streptomyces sp. NPDC096030]|uniref:Gfo/Idh/MocA family protein n=1 Tax=Streptomyces sp. NPDC096030 TaxID=3155423 RepID=UPI0033312418